MSADRDLDAPRPPDGSSPPADVSGGSAGAVFLSYAREDTPAVRRLADALRAFGIEVWFDLSELRGGDAWDAQIKKQIRECALFVPIISATTEGRSEGYFRREWKFAAERTHDMGARRAFLVPIVIDDTKEGTADVPEEFLRSHWTRLPQGMPTPQFIERMRHLLEAARAPAGKSAAPIPPADPARGARAAAASRGRGWRRGALVALTIAAVSGAGFLALQWTKPRRAMPEPAAVPAAAPPAEPVVAPPKVAEKSIAVLPFANLSTEKDNEFFADGMCDDVITHLAKIRGLTVISRTSVLAYRDAAARNLKRIGAELGVATVLEGSVRRVGNQVHVNAQLIDARTDAHLWADTFDGDTSDLFTLQAKLAQQIAGALKATLTAGARELIERRPTRDAQAYDLYHRAAMLEESLNTRSSRDKYDQVVDLYEQAVRRDDAFALAHARLSSVQANMYFIASLDRTPGRRARAEAALRSAERLAPAAPETRVARGSFIYYCDDDYRGALAEFHAAEEGLPNDPALLARTGSVLRRLDRLPDAINALERAAALNPRHLYIGTQLTQALFTARRFASARAAAQRYIALGSADGWMHELASRAQFAIEGDRAAYLRAREAAPFVDSDPDGLRAVYERAMLRGDFAAAARALANPRLTRVPNWDNVFTDPVALHRALVARLQGDAAAAGRFADDAIAFCRTTRWTAKQEPFALLCTARAEAYAGRADAAVRDVEAAVTQIARSDNVAAMTARFEAARLYASLQRRDEALGALRELLRGPSYVSPVELRYDPLLAPLKDDPRFNEILGAARPL